MVIRKRLQLKLRSRTLNLGDRTLVMGVLNVTPDSFSDGGKFLDPQRAVEHALEMERAGADLLDIGGESTRPGSTGTAAGTGLAGDLAGFGGPARRPKNSHLYRHTQIPGSGSRH